MSLDLERLVAIDVHVHAERNAGEEQDPVTGEILAAAAEYFGGSPPQPTAAGGGGALPRAQHGRGDVHRRRRGGHGPAAARQRRGARGRRANPDVLIPFASVDPHKGKLGVREARALIERGVRGFKFHPNTQAFWPNDRAWYPLYEVIAEAGLIALFHTGTTGIGAGHAGRRRRAPEVLQPDAGRRRRRRLPRARHHPRPPLVPVAGGGARDRGPQAQRLHRPLRLVAEVLPGDPRPLHEHAAQGQDAVRLGLPADHARPLAGGLRQARRSATRCARSC